MKKLLKRMQAMCLALVLVLGLVPTAFAADDGAQFKNGPYLLAPKTLSLIHISEPTRL